MSSLASRLTAKGLTSGGAVTGGGGGSTVNVSGSAVTLDNVLALNAANIDVSVNYVRVAGYWVLGDQGSGAYRRKNAIEVDLPGDQTSNGGTVRWEVIVEGDAVLSAWRFGLKNVSSFQFEETPGSATDAYAAFMKADKYIYAKNLAGITLHVGPAFLYTSKPINFKRKGYVVKGCTNNGTTIRCPAYSDVFCVNYQWGTGPDYGLSLNNFTSDAGTGIYKQEGKTGEGNCYRCIVSGVTDLSTDPLSGTDPNATYTWGTAQFKFERYVGPNGPDPYDWDITASNSASNMRIEDIQLWSFWDPRSSDPAVNKWPDQHGKPGRGQFNCGIIERVRTRLNNIFSLQFPGHGVAIVADGDPELTGPGNVNGYHNDHLFLYYSGKDGLHVGYSDANAGTTIYLDTASNKRFGYAEWSFLGNFCAMHQSAFDGKQNFQAPDWLPQKQYPSGCTYNGYYWNARLPLLGVQGWPAYINEVPGGANNAWTQFGGGGTVAAGQNNWDYPDWTPTQQFEPGGAFGSNNVNARNVFLSMYIEGGTFTAQPGAQDVVFGGLTENLDYTRGAAIFSDNNWSYVKTYSLNFGDLQMSETNGIPTGVGQPYEIRWNYSGGSGNPMGWQYISGTWRALANRA